MPTIESNRRKKIKNLDSKLLTRRPVLLAQIKAGYNSCKLKNEIRQILHLLYQHNKIRSINQIKSSHYNNGRQWTHRNNRTQTFHFDLPTDAGINLKHEIYSFNTKWFRFSVRYSSLYWVYHKKYEKLPTNPPIHIYINRITNRLIFKIKDGYKLELKIPEIRVPELWLDMSFGPKLPQTSF